MNSKSLYTDFATDALIIGDKDGVSAWDTNNYVTMFDLKIF